ncbi:DUF3861 domain-containing protein [Pseudodesulfovibrio indicus]|jgi:hypothetical protein|uniref:Uncharacterized protein DUF3861 n=1 Tax=Pseudodesulfovibrio indicus TaxID=1716143 RepID=A0A126QLS5_9BACT|nr:DUF3861 domain-containing protein [Pseudodesulfovibrio indicus]AMK11013.1 hypothetical protein AWY79_07755 [Pseudodesulfovibrio indicus]TDT92016.1 uncharacterized protein DUF3861 [Pseudodesulfovibrio indicus]
MKRHQYRITVEPMESTGSAPLSFEVNSYDDILMIIDRIRLRKDIAPGSAEALGLGLKLFGNELLQQKNNPLFAPLFPCFHEFMKLLKESQP